MQKFLSVVAIAAVIASMAAATPAAASGYVFQPLSTRSTGPALSVFTTPGSVHHSCAGGTIHTNINATPVAKWTALDIGGGTTCDSPVLGGFPMKMTPTGPMTFTVAGTLSFTVDGILCNVDGMTGLLGAGGVLQITGGQQAGCFVNIRGTIDSPPIYIDVAPKPPTPPK